MVAIDFKNKLDDHKKDVVLFHLGHIDNHGCLP
jgi:hypothetical protein